MPNYFLVTVTSTDGVIVTAVQQPVATLRVALPQNVDECLIVNISAGNSAGMSLPTEFTVGMLITIFPQSGTVAAELLIIHHWFLCYKLFNWGICVGLWICKLRRLLVLESLEGIGF